MRKLLLVSISFYWALAVYAQQEPMFTKYMFNSLAYNPAFAGSPDYLSVRALYRNQWWGIKDGGNPITQSFTIHGPVKNRVGLGLSLVNDAIGATASTVANASYAYRMPFGKGKLALGLQAGALYWRADWSKLKFKDPQQSDEAFQDINPQRWLPNFGAGLFFHSQLYYIGLSVPRLIEWSLRDEGSRGNNVQVNEAQLYRHYYLAAGAALPLRGSSLIFKPSVLVKSVGLLGEFFSASNTLRRVGAPTEIDLDASFMFYEVFWLGASFRTAIEGIIPTGNSDNRYKSSIDSADLWASFYLGNGLRIGASYDYTLTELREYGKGTFEVMLGYDFNYRVKKINTPRYF